MRGSTLAIFAALALIASGPALADMGTPEKKAQAQAGEALRSLRDIAPALEKCWTPPTIEGVGEITVRLSFNRVGAIIGEPRITYARAVAAEDQRLLKASLLEALARCGPLPLSPSLGAAIAGRIFAIRFLVTNQKGQDI